VLLLRPDASIVIENDGHGVDLGPLQGLRHLRRRVAPWTAITMSVEEKEYRGYRRRHPRGHRPTRRSPKPMRQITRRRGPTPHPQTERSRIFAQYVADGKVDTEFIT